jgi:transcriptional regulator with GAF, ATPase, and Fis domain
MNHIDILEHFLKNPGRFSILIIGERGTGKTKWVKEIVQNNLKRKVVYANCASFSNDAMAESELFGYKKGAYTDAIADKDGLFIEADNNYLFLDEVHNLSKRVQEKLMTALQTEGSGKNKGNFCIRQLGDNELKHVSTTPIFASNLPLVKLRKKLLPDLYDRLSQLVVEIPSIQESNVDLQKAFRQVWRDMDFKQYSFPPNSPQFIRWLRSIPLEGNYRTLQNIAINWHQARLMFYRETKDLNDDTEALVFEYVKNQITKYHNSNLVIIDNSRYNFRKGVSKKEMGQEYFNAMLSWAFSEEGYGEKQRDVQKGLQTTSRCRKPLNK